MNKTEDIFNKAKNEVQKLWDNQNELSDFVKFPDNLILKNIKSKKVPITNRLLNWKNNINTNHKDVHLAISALSPYAKWEQGYDEKDVGNDFLNKYGFLLVDYLGPVPSLDAFISMTTFLILISVFYFIPTGIIILWAPTQIGAGICSILFLSEIIVGAVSSSILTDEPFGWRQIVGCSLIIFGGIVAVVLSPKENVSKQ